MEAVSGSGTLPMIVVVVLAGVCFLMFFLRKEKKEPVKKTQGAVITGIPQGMEEDYRCGVNPCGCGMPVMYTLHTCRHCVRLKNFLDQHGITHRLIYVDDFTESARRQIMMTLRSYNDRGSFPTLVVPDGRSVVGFREDAVKKLFDID